MIHLCDPPMVPDETRRLAVNQKALCGEVVESPAQRKTLPQLPGTTFHAGNPLCPGCGEKLEERNGS